MDKKNEVATWRLDAIIAVYSGSLELWNLGTIRAYAPARMNYETKHE